MTIEGRVAAVPYISGIDLLERGQEIRCPVPTSSPGTLAGPFSSLLGAAWGPEEVMAELSASDAPPRPHQCLRPTAVSTGQGLLRVCSGEDCSVLSAAGLRRASVKPFWSRREGSGVPWPGDAGSQDRWGRLHP